MFLCVTTGFLLSGLGAGPGLSLEQQKESLALCFKLETEKELKMKQESVRILKIQTQMQTETQTALNRNLSYRVHPEKLKYLDSEVKCCDIAESFCSSPRWLVPMSDNKPRFCSDFHKVKLCHKTRLFPSGSIRSLRGRETLQRLLPV